MKTKHPFYHQGECDCGCSHEKRNSGEMTVGNACCEGEHQQNNVNEEGHCHGLKTVHGPDCTCELCHPHAEYCDVCGRSLSQCVCSMPDDGLEKAVYDMENLGCANCAAKMERKIKDLPGVKYVSITFSTKQMRLAAEDHESLLPRIQEICSDIESDVRVVPRERSVGMTKTVVWNISGPENAAEETELEEAVAELPGVCSVVLLPGTRQLKVTAPSPERLKPQIEEVCKKINPHLRLTLEKAGKPETEKPSFWQKEGNKEIVFLLIGTVFLIGALVFSVLDLPSLPLYIVAYLVLAKDILLSAGKNILKGHVFDENFLMAIASLGAFLIGDYTEAVAVVLFFCVGEIFEERAVAKSRGQIMEAVDMRPETVHLLIGEQTTEIPAEDAVVGDILLVRPGDRIPLDGVIIEGESRVDTSPVTGEPVPVAVGFGDEVISGCINTSGVLKLRVEKVLDESMVTRILDSVEQAAASKPKIDRFITRFARIYTPCVVILAVATAVIPSLITGAWSQWIYTALTFLVISCPCALVLSVPLAYFSGIGYGSRRGILFKGGVALEALRDVRAVVMDKTGTVTKGCFAVTRISCANGFTEEAVLSAAAAVEMASTHPIGASIVASAKERELMLIRPEEIREIAGRGIEAVLNGGEVLCGSASLLKEKGVEVPVKPQDFQGTEVYLALDGVFAGVILISDIVKDDAKEAVSEMTSLGLSTVMLTGDRAETAAAVASETGISAYHAELMPQDKLTAIGQIRDRFGPVMFVGDGINDAPVLAGSDVGAAMGSGADAAIEAADVVFMTSEMKAVPAALKIARKVGRVAAQNVVFALAVKLSVMVLGLMGLANMWFAIFADTGVAMICILNSIRILYGKVR
ncbi:MAG: heavy metal translocating P-type ATPase [Clostridia bacterium]